MGSDTDLPGVVTLFASGLCAELQANEAELDTIEHALGLPKRWMLGLLNNSSCRRSISLRESLGTYGRRVW